LAVNGNQETIWKTISLVLVTILVTGTPGIVYALRTWSVNDEVHLIRDRQDNVRDRLTTSEQEIRGLHLDVDRLQRQIDVLNERLEAHVSAPHKP
jgi:uncharacterized protein YpmS